MRTLNYQISGLVTLTNTQQYPFNDSLQTAALEASRDNAEYSIQTEIVSASGEVGDILISAKAVNGFKIAFTGSARQVVLRYYLSGGLQDDRK